MGSIGLWSEENIIVTGKAPVADCFAGTVGYDVINISKAHRLTGFVWTGVGTTGTFTITVEACDDVTPTNTSAVAFKYRRVSDHSSSDTYGAVTAATSAGFTTTAGSAQWYIVEVDVAALAASGYKYARLKTVESVDSPVLGGVFYVLSQLREEQATHATVLT